MHAGGLQHKNLIISSTIAFVAVALVFFFTRENEISFRETTLIAQKLQNSEPVTADIDTDNDGLPDWKEKLYGSNIYEVDSDGDGANDGDEVRVGRNPMQPNTAQPGTPPNDKLAYLMDLNIATSSTDLLGIKKEFFALYLAEGSRSIKEDTFRNVMKEVDAKKFAPKHDLLALTISSNNSSEGIKLYVNAFGVVIKKYLNHRLNRSEDDLIESALAKKDSGAQEELQLLAVAYKNFASDLLSLSVPSTLARAHLLIVNGYEGVGTGLLGVVKIQDDPMNGTAGYQAYLKYRLDVTNGYGMIVAYISDQKITFTATDPGYPFYWSTLPPE